MTVYHAGTRLGGRAPGHRGGRVLSVCGRGGDPRRGHGDRLPGRRRGSLSRACTTDADIGADSLAATWGGAVEPVDVVLLLGSASDCPHLRPAVEVLRAARRSVPASMSARRTGRRERTGELVRSRRARRLPGLHLRRRHGGAPRRRGRRRTPCAPVLGVPLPGGVLDGVDALLSTVQMPGGVPVATFAVGVGRGPQRGLLRRPDRWPADRAELAPRWSSAQRCRARSWSTANVTPRRRSRARRGPLGEGRSELEMMPCRVARSWCRSSTTGCRCWSTPTCRRCPCRAAGHPVAHGDLVRGRDGDGLFRGQRVDPVRRAGRRGEPRGGSGRVLRRATDRGSAGRRSSARAPRAGDRCLPPPADPRAGDRPAPPQGPCCRWPGARRWCTSPPSSGSTSGRC